MRELRTASTRCEKPNPLDEFAGHFVDRDGLEWLWAKTEYTLVVDDLVAEGDAAEQLRPVARNGEDLRAVQLGDGAFSSDWRLGAGDTCEFGGFAVRCQKRGQIVCVVGVEWR